MALVVGQAGYQLYNALPREAQAQVRDFILSLPGRAYEHRHEIIEYIKRLQQIPKRSGPDPDRDFPSGEGMKRSHDGSHDGPSSKEARVFRQRRGVQLSLEPMKGMCLCGQKCQSTKEMTKNKNGTMITCFLYIAVIIEMVVRLKMNAKGVI